MHSLLFPLSHLFHADLINWAGRFPGAVILNGPPKRELALTFDDGPDDVWTPQVLDDLRMLGAKATFFCVGRRVEANPGDCQEKSVTSETRI